MKYTLKSFILIVITILIGSCDEDCDLCQFKMAPVLTTLPVIEIDINGTRFSAEITDYGDYEMLSHGFVWSLWRYPQLGSQSENITFEGSSEEDSFSTLITSKFYEGHPYHVRAFVQVDGFISYGNDVVFTSAESSENSK